jgi:hypothetical protein
MARYGTFLYDTELYGAIGNLTSSGIRARVVDYGTVEITISTPDRIGKDYVLVRSYNGAAEHPNEGTLVSSGTLSSASVQIDVLDEASNNPYGWCYYTLFVVDNLEWKKDAATSLLIPYDRGTFQYLMENLPSIFTSEGLNPLEPVDYNSDLAKFLKGIALTYDEWAGHIDSVLPDSRNKEVVRRLDPTRAVSVGMPNEYTIGTAAAHRMFSQAGYIYKNKGTLEGISTYVKALTGWDTSCYEGYNLLLDLNDCSFETSIGNWSIAGGTLVVEEVDGVDAVSCDLYDAQTGPMFDFNRGGVGKVTLSGASATLTLHSSDLLKTVPVPFESNTGDSFTFVVPAIADVGTPTVTSTITWLDGVGGTISATSGSGLVTSASWAAASVTSTVPAGAKYARLSITVTGSASNVVHLDMLYFGETQSPFYYWDARSVDIVCSPVLINQIMDPSCDDEAHTYWISPDATLSVTDEEAVQGLNSLKIVGASAFTVYHCPTSIVPAQYYTLRLGAKGAGATLIANIEWYDSSFNLVDTSDDLDFGTLTADWLSGTLSVVSPDGAEFALIKLSGTGTAYVDTLVFANASSLPAFFSGSVGDVAGEDVDWYGTIGQSISTLYPAKITKLSRLRDTLSYYLPLGVSWRLLLWGDSVVINNVIDYIPYADTMDQFIADRAVLYLDARYSGSGQTVTNLGTSGAALNATRGSTGSADSNDPEPLVFAGTPYVYLPGLANNSLSVPTIVSVASSTDKFVWVDVELPDWTPSASASRLIGTRGGTATGYELIIRSGGTLEFQWRDSGTVSWRSRTSSALGFTDGTRHLIGASLDLDNGAGGVTCRFWESTDQGATWTQIGTNQTMATVAAITVGTDSIEIGTRGTSNDPLVGKIYGGGIYNAIDGSGKPSGAAALTVDCSVLTSGSATSFTATVGGTVTINRATSGRKAVAVVDNVWLFGSDDYMEIVDHPDLDFDADDSFTVLAAIRGFPTLGNFTRIMSKKDSSGAGWDFLTGTNPALQVDINDGTNSNSRANINLTNGVISVVGFEVDRESQTLALLSGTTTGVTTSTSSVGSLVNSLALRVGARAGVLAQHSDMELMAVLLVRRTLLPAELALINAYFKSR